MSSLAERPSVSPDASPDPDRPDSPASRADASQSTPGALPATGACPTGSSLPDDDDDLRVYVQVDGCDDVACMHVNGGQQVHTPNGDPSTDGAEPGHLATPLTLLPDPLTVLLETPTCPCGLPPHVDMRVIPADTWIDRAARVHAPMVLDCVARVRDKTRRDSPLYPWRAIGEEGRLAFCWWLDEIGFEPEMDFDWLRFDRFLTACVEGVAVRFSLPAPPESIDVTF